MFTGRATHAENMKRMEVEKVIHNPMHIEQICRNETKIRCWAELSTT